MKKIVLLVPLLLCFGLISCTKQTKVSVSHTIYRPSSNDYGTIKGISTPGASIKLRSNDELNEKDSWWAETTVKSNGTFKLKYYYEGYKKLKSTLTATKKDYKSSNQSVTIVPSKENE